MVRSIVSGATHPSVMALLFPSLHPLSRAASPRSLLKREPIFLASQDALEVMSVTEWVSHSLSVSIDFTDVTLVSDDTYRWLYWYNPDDSDEHNDPDNRWKLSGDESYLVMKVT